MAEQVGGMILEKIVEKLVDPIFRQFSYLFCYNQASLLRRAEVVASEKVYGEKSIMKEADEDGFMKLCMWGGRVQPPSLVNLKVVEMRECHEIVNLFSSPAARCLVQLQQLTVGECFKLKEIVWKDESDTNMIGFPKLKKMRLSWLPSFKSFVAVDYNNHSRSIFNEVLLPSIETLMLLRINDVVKLVDGKTNPAASFHKLETIEVRYCDSMEVVFDLEGVDVVLNENREKVIVFSQLHTIHILHLPELKHIWKNGPKEIRLQAGSHFQNLKSLNLHDCRKMEYVLYVSMAKLLVNLEIIVISCCKSMEQVIKMDDEEEEEEGITRERDKIVFPQLRKLYLDSVGLKVFCQGNHHLEFPALEDVTIADCPKMYNFCSGSLSTPMSMKISIQFEEKESSWKGDLNKTVQYIYQSDDDDEEEE